MTIDKNSYIKIPTIVITVGLPLVVALIGSYITVKVATAQIQEKVLMIEAADVKLDGEKLDKEVYEATQKAIMQSLNEIKQDMKELKNKK